MKLKLAIFTVILSASLAAHALTEAELVSNSEASMALLKKGQISELEHFKYVYGLVKDMPASYRWKADNLRIFGHRIDLLEDVAAGKITREKAEREFAQKDAEYDKRELDRTQAARQSAQARREAAEAADDAQRRALALQMLQNRPAAVQIQPYQIPKPVQCRSTPVFGGGFQTVCN